jgi:PAS domain S-box-containing protein
MKRPEEVRIHSEELYRELFEFSPTPNAIFDQEGRCLLVNWAFIHLFGYDKDTLLNKSFQFKDLFVYKDIAHSITTEIQEKLILRRREVLLQDLDGHRRTMLLSGRALQIEDQPAYEVSLMDISRQKQLERTIRYDHSRMLSLIEGLTVGLFLVDNNGVIIETNRALENLLALENTTIKQEPYQELFALLLSNAVEPEVVQQSLHQAVTTVAEHPVIDIAMKEKPFRYLEMTFFPVWDDEGIPIGWGGLVQDVTEDRDRQSWKLEILSILAHDIRAPLASLKGHVTALLANYRQWGEEMVMEFLETINRNTDQLTRQVDRSLALTRVEAGNLGLRPEVIQPSLIIHHSIEQIAGSLSETRLHLDFPPELPLVRADPARIEEVLVNLLDNAARYAPSDSPIQISAVPEGSLLHISVIDHGPGIPKEKQGVIFDKFVRVDPDSDGTGLGLFISRKIIQAHGGQIWVESPLSGVSYGTKFTFTLPFVPAESKAPTGRKPTEPLSPTAPEERLLILVVEDEPDFQALFRSILIDAGYQTEVVPTGPAAIDFIQSSSPDLVLLDWMLPGMDGLNICRNIRRWSDVPILIVTSKTSQEDLVAAFNAGADDYVTKPFKTPELLARILALSRRRTSWKETELDVLNVNGLLINFDSREVWRQGARLNLTPTEFKLLAYLAQHPGQVLTYQQLLTHIYHEEGQRTRHDLFVHVSRLRKKIETEPTDPRFILTRWGIGYMFAPK